MSVAKFIKSYQLSNPERFNEDLINLKKNEDITMYISDVCRSLEIIEYIEFLGCEYQEMNKVYKNTQASKEIDIEESRLVNLVMKFRISKDGEEEIIEKKLFFPELIDGQYFIINGNRFFPVFQLVDSGTYKTSKAVTLKTILMPISTREDKKGKFEDMDGTSYSSKVLVLNIFKGKLNFFIYYYAKFGFDKALNYFGLDQYLSVTEEKDEDADITFSINKNLFINIFDSESLDDPNTRILIFTFLRSLPQRINTKKIQDHEYWIKKLGSNFTKNNSNQHQKGLSILASFERLLDETTKRNLRLPTRDKENIYSIVRWMASNYSILYKQDNMDLSNKRLRLYEYLIYPLVMKFSSNIYRIQNSRNVTMQQLKSMFNIQQGFLVKALVSNELIRYSNAVNSIDLFTSILKGTMSGPQSQMSGGNTINVRYRGIHSSYLGRFDLCATAASDPGVSFTLTPFCDIYENMHFTKEPSYAEIIDLEETIEEEDLT